MNIQVVVPVSLEFLFLYMGGYVRNKAIGEMYRFCHQYDWVPHHITLVWQGLSVNVPPEYQDTVRIAYVPDGWLFVYRAIAIPEVKQPA